MSWFQKLVGRNPVQPATRSHQSLAAWPAAIYAIGDVHGCKDLLRELEKRIFEHGDKIAGDKLIVLLGDLVDRGDDSAGVLDLVLSRPPAGFQRISLAGNHEVMFQRFLDDPSPTSDWLGFGGLETLASYGIPISGLEHLKPRAIRALLDSHIPEEHVSLLRRLPLSLTLPGTLFVHAGIRPGVPLERQTEDDLLWIREPFLSFDFPASERVIHGHTPGPEPVVAGGRICIDTGAYATGVLTACFLTPQQHEFIMVAGQ